MTISNSTLSGNNAVGNAGNPGLDRTTYVGARGGSGGNGQDAYGGGLYVAGGTVKLSNDTFADNTAVGGTGGIGGAGGYGTDGITAGAGGSGGAGGTGMGGALFVAKGAVTLIGDTFKANVAQGGQGGQGGDGGQGGKGLNASGGSGGAGGDGYQGGSGGRGEYGGASGGGGVLVSGGHLILSNDTFNANVAQGGQGGQGGDGGQGGKGGNGTFSSLNGVSGGAGGTGGAGGDAGGGGHGVNASGGGLRVTGGSATLVNVIISANQATGGSGGSGGTGGTGGTGGKGGYGGSASSAGGVGGDGGSGGGGSGGGGGGYASGGGLWVTGIGGVAHLVNVTISANQATGGGGGVVGSGGTGGTGGTGGKGGYGYFYQPTTNSYTSGYYPDGNPGAAGSAGTSTGAGGDGYGGGLGGTFIVLVNTLVAGNNASTEGPDVYGSVQSSDHDLIGDSSGSSGFSTANGDILDPSYVGLGALAYNGGTTQTMALLPDSQAIDNGDNNVSGLPATDQRGYSRTVGNGVDIGATEYQYDMSVTPSLAAGNTLGTVQYNYIVTNNGPDSVSGATLTVTLPSGINLSSITFTPPGWTETDSGAGNSGTITFTDNNSLPSGLTYLFTIAASVGNSTLGASLVTTATLGPTPWETNTQNNSGNLTVTNEQEGQAFNQVKLFHFTDADSNAAANFFTATVNWGDGSTNTSSDGSGAVSVVADGNGGFDVFGSHTYSAVGDYAFSVSVDGPDGTQVAKTSVSPQQMFVASDAPLTEVALTPPPNAAVNQAITNAVLFHFTDANPNAAASDYTAAVSWGDGSSDSSNDVNAVVSIAADPTGGFDVIGSHTYGQILTPGTFSVQVSDADGASTSASDNSFQVLNADEPLTAGTLDVPAVTMEGQSINNQLLFQFADQDPYAQFSDFLASVYWGDGSANSSNDGSGSVQATAISTNSDGSIVFGVYGSHQYLAGNSSFSVRVDDLGDDSSQHLDLGGQVAAAFSSTPLDISELPVSALGGSTTFSASEGSLSTVQTVATFTDPGVPSSDGSAYQAFVQWGDGTLTEATPNGQSTYSAPTVSNSYVPVVDTPGVSVSNGSLAAGTYYYVVTSTTANGESTPSREVNATLTSTGEVALTWGQVAGATGYNIYRGSSTSAEDALIGAISSGSGATVSFTDDGTETTTPSTPPTSNTAAGSGSIDYVPALTAQSASANNGALSAGAYYYTVTSATATSESTPSNEVSVTTTGSSGAVALSWNQVAGASGYRIYRGTSPGAEDALIAVINSGTTLSFTDDGTEPTYSAQPQQVLGRQLVSGSTTPGISSDGQTFSIDLAHQYAEQGSYTINTLINHYGQFSNTVTTAATVSDPALIVTAGLPFAATEGVASSIQTLASFTDPGGPESDPNAYTATVTWGDGASSTATLANGGIVLGGDGKTFSVNLAHQYADEGTYSISIALNHEGVSTPAVTTTATVADNDKLTATAGGALAISYGTPLTNATLATFTDTYAGNTASDFAANIDWGDGQSSVGTVSGSNGNFIVTGDHSYAQASAYTISVTINDDGAGTATAAATATTKATIGPLAVTLDGTRVYDGTATAAASLLTVTNLVSGDDLTLTGAVALASPNVGDEAISSFSGLSLGGSSAGNYTLTGATGSVMITQATTSFSNLTVQDIIVGTSTTTVSGDLTSDTIVPAGQSVSITLNGVTESATVGSDGHFEDDFNTAALQVGAYPISYSYGGDNNFTAASGTGALTVAYDTQLLFNNSKPVHSGAVLPIKLELTDASGADVSSPNIAVSAVELVGPDGQASLNSPGNSNPNGLFRYDPSLGGYIFNLSTKGLSDGTYTLYYEAGNDPTRHSLTFEVGDASKAKLSHASLSQTATPGKADAAQTPFASFISAAFQDLLHRAPDDSGLIYWNQKLAAGLPPAQFAQELTHSAEFYATNVIAPDYQTFLGRAADAAGLASWTSRMQHGLTDQQLEAGFIASPEFYAHAGGTNAAWVDAIYQSVLGRQADSGARHYWMAQLAAGRNRLSVAMSVAASQEREAQMIQDDYFAYLGRTAGQAETDYWVARFEHGATNEDIIGALVGSSEYIKLHS